MKKDQGGPRKDEQIKKEPIEVMVPADYLRYRLDELLKNNQAVITEYNFLLSALNPKKEDAPATTKE